MGSPIPWRPLLVEPGSTTHGSTSPSHQDRDGAAGPHSWQEKRDRTGPQHQLSLLGPRSEQRAGPFRDQLARRALPSIPGPGKSAGHGEGGALYQPRALGVLEAPGAVGGRGAQREQLLPAGGDGIQGAQQEPPPAAWTPGRARLRPPAPLSGTRRSGRGHGPHPPLPPAPVGSLGREAAAVGAGGDAHLAQLPAVASHHCLSAHRHSPRRLLQSPAAAPSHRPT